MTYSQSPARPVSVRSILALIVGTVAIIAAIGTVGALLRTHTTRPVTTHPVTTLPGNHPAGYHPTGHHPSSRVLASVAFSIRPHASVTAGRGTVYGRIHGASVDITRHGRYVRSIYLPADWNADGTVERFRPCRQCRAVLTFDGVTLSNVSRWAVNVGTTLETF